MSWSAGGFGGRPGSGSSGIRSSGRTATLLPSMAHSDSFNTAVPPTEPASSSLSVWTSLHWSVTTRPARPRSVPCASAGSPPDPAARAP